MAYESLRGETNDHTFPQPHLSRSPWPTKSNEYQYNALSSPYEIQRKPVRTSPQPSITSDFQSIQHDGPSSSTTAILEGGARPVYQLHGVSHGITGNPWHPGFWAQFPWLGMLALLITVLATLACIVVLVRSNGVPIEQWPGKLQPTVYLSVCSAIANITLTYALYEGVVISFWRKAGQGATLGELHQYWHSGSSLWGAFTGVFQFRAKATAFACIMTVLSIGRGPLMQRASSVKNTIVQTQGNLRMFSAIRIPDGYAGRDTGRTSTPSFMNPNFTDIVQAYTNKDPIAGIYSGCDSTCYASVKGFGFGVSCNDSTIPYIMDPIIGPNNSVTLRLPIQVFGADAWQTPAVIPNVPQYYNYALLLNTTRMGIPTKAWNGTLLQRLCTLRAGITSYPTKVSNGTITLQSPSWQNDTFLEDVGMQALPYNSVSNLAGFILAAKGLYAGSATMQFGGGAGWILNLNGASANRYIQRTNPTANSLSVDSNITWRDPMDDMVNSMREIAFRMSLQIAKDNTSYPNASQVLPFTGEKPETIYTANYTYMACAVALSLLGVIAVLPTYRGFWELGRRVTLSPLEIAKAFHAPLLGGIQGNRPASDMLVELSGTKVRYGDSGVIVGEQYSSPYEAAQLVKRIGIGPATGIRPPEKGVRYI